MALAASKAKHRAELDVLRTQVEAYSCQAAIYSKEFDRCKKKLSSNETLIDQLENSNKVIKNKLDIVQDEVISLKTHIGAITTNKTSWNTPPQTITVAASEISAGTTGGNDVVLVAGHRNILSNFYGESVTVFNCRFKSREHAYQYKKAMFHNKHMLAEQIYNAYHSGKAKHLGTFDTSPEWKKVKLSVMEEIVTAMANQSTLFKDTLIKTGNKKIVENIKTEFWGIGQNNTGKNNFGQVLMKVRSTLLQRNAQSRESSQTVAPRPKVLLVGNSLLNRITPSKISSSFDCTKETAYNNKEILDVVNKSTTHYSCVVLQGITNDVQHSSPEKVVSEMEHNVKVIKEKIKPKTIIISNAPPTGNDTRNCNVGIANALCQRIAQNHKEVEICEHSILYRQGKQDLKYFATDGVHLNDRGSSILASNLKKSIYGGLGLTLPYTSRGMNSSQSNNPQGESQDYRPASRKTPPNYHQAPQDYHQAPQDYYNHTQYWPQYGYKGRHPRNTYGGY